MDQRYHARRAAQETGAAARASCPESRLVHEAMAGRHRALATGAPRTPDPLHA